MPVKRLGLAIVLAFAVVGPAGAQVSIDIGIRLPSPPPLAVIPNTVVYYAPNAPANVFFYGHQYWVYQPTGWYVGAELERAVGNRPAGVRAAAHLESARPLLSRSARPVEEVAARGAAAVGRELWS